MTVSNEKENTGQTHIKVVVRVRPHNHAEAQANSKTVVKVLGENVIVFDPKEQSSPEFYRGKQRKSRDLLKRKNRDMQFAFDRVFDDDCTNVDVYENTTRDVLGGLLDGYNCSVFAYGATGAGKTFTMLGSQSNPGLMFYTMMDLYERIDAMKQDKTCEVAVSYLEVYNEQIRDLLIPSGFLPIREDPQRGGIVNGLSLHKPRDAKELLHMLDFGNKNRTQHPTDANAESSRSHAVFQVFVRQRDRTGNISADVRVAKMSLIDLAGSERATVTTNRGQRFREGANINKSLLALGNCINALADGKSKGYIPYRNSKLTRLLKDSLGGNCRTVMISAVSPSSLSYEDTYNTLKYANRAKNIKATLKRNVVSVDFHITKYQKIVDELRQEVSELKIQLKVKCDCDGVNTNNNATSLPAPSAPLFPQPSESAPQVPGQGLIPTEDINREQGKLFKVFEQRMNIRKELMELEGSSRDVCFKIHAKENYLSRVSTVFYDPAVLQQLKSKTEGQLSSLQQRQLNISRRKVAAEEKMQQNANWLKNTEKAMAKVGPDGAIPEILEISLRTRHLEVELRDTKRHVKYLKKLCRAQQRKASADDRLIQNLLQTVKEQFFQLKGHNIATRDVISKFEAIQHMVNTGKEVAWADQSTDGEVVQLSTEQGQAAKAELYGNKQFEDLLDFPVLACVNTTPKGGQNRRRSAMQELPTTTPYVNRKNPPNTPGRSSNRKGNKSPWRKRNPGTPRNNSRIPTPGSGPRHRPVYGGPSVPYSHNNNTNSDIASSDSQHPRLQNTHNVQANFHSANSNNDCPQSRLFTSYAPTTPGSTHKNVPRTNANTPFKEPEPVTLQSQTPKLDSTYTMVEGVFPLQPSPVYTDSVQTSAIQSSSVQSSSVQSSSVQLSDSSDSSDCVDNRTVTLPKPSVQLVTSSQNCVQNVVPNIQNTVPKSVQNSVPTKVQNSVPTSVHPGASSNTASTVIVKDFPAAHLAEDSAPNAINCTVTKQRPPTVNSATVTKSHIGDKENSTSPCGNNKDVVRAMDFSECDKPRPAGKLTFAEALKSPPLNNPTVQRLRERDHFRPPLSPKENTLHVHNIHDARRVTFSEKELHKNKARLLHSKNTDLHPSQVRRATVASNQIDQKFNHTLKTLKAAGIPSIYEALVLQKDSKPSYMQMTKAASHRQAEVLHRPHRDQENIAPNNKLHQRTKSSTSLPKNQQQQFKRHKSSSNVHNNQHNTQHHNHAKKSTFF